MAAEAGWYADPTRAGRLRYWDGAAWSEHVSEGGGTRVEVIAGDPPAPPAAPPGPAVPAGTAAAAARGGPALPYPWTPLGRAGFAVAAAGGIMAAATSGSTVVSQDLGVRISVAGGWWIGLAAAVVCAAAALAPWVWARLAGIGLATLFAIILAFALIGFRTSDDLVTGLDVTLGAAGWLLLGGSLLLFAGTAIALAGFRRPVAGADGSVAPREGKAVASLVLGIVGLPIPIVAGPAVGFALMAMDDVRASDGRVGGRGLAIAGLVLGIVSLALWGVGLLLGMLLAQP
jgi:hypothetical protein